VSSYTNTSYPSRNIFIIAACIIIYKYYSLYFNSHYTGKHGVFREFRCLISLDESRGDVCIANRVGLDFSIRSTRKTCILKRINVISFENQVHVALFISYGTVRNAISFSINILIKIHEQCINIILRCPDLPTRRPLA